VSSSQTPPTDRWRESVATEQVVAHASLTRQFDPLTGSTVDYSLTDGRLAGSFRTQTHAVRIA